MKVFEFPPKESFSIKVNFESLYGICLYFPLLNSTSALITVPKTVKDLLMFEDSFN